jgi:hypothetical protein
MDTPTLGHEWVVDHPAPPKSFDPEGVHCAKCGIKGLRWVKHYVVSVDDPAGILASRSWEAWKTMRKWVSAVCYGVKRRPTPPPGSMRPGP